jgi:hypothetical protein
VLLGRLPINWLYSPAFAHRDDLKSFPVIALNVFETFFLRDLSEIV